METSLNKDHSLFKRLKENPQLWWSNLKSDPDLYIDIRKDNYINVYYNGGSIIRLGGESKFKAKIHFEYIPLEKDSDYLSYEFQNGNISLKEQKVIDINNFEKQSLDKIKKRIKQFYPDNSEKGIQGKYIIHNNKISKNGNGFFVDTEFQYKDSRIDMVWVDLITKEIAFVELKTIGDQRLYLDTNNNSQKINDQVKDMIDAQLRKYYDFANTNRKALIQYYDKVFQIKKKLGILPDFVNDNSLSNYDLIEKPILLVGDCTQQWIDDYAKKTLIPQLKDIAFACVFHGPKTYNFNIPDKSTHNRFRLDNN
jgi:hypothetical protein